MRVGGPPLVEAVFSSMRATAKGSFDDLHDHRTGRSDRANRGPSILGLRGHRPALDGGLSDPMRRRIGPILRCDEARIGPSRGAASIVASLPDEPVEDGDEERERGRRRKARWKLWHCQLRATGHKPLSAHLFLSLARRCQQADLGTMAPGIGGFMPFSMAPFSAGC